MVVFSGERETYGRRRQGVGELVGAPVIVGVVRSDLVVDEEAPGSSCVSWGGLLLRRASATVGGGELAIGGLRW